MAGWNHRLDGCEFVVSNLIHCRGILAADPLLSVQFQGSLVAVNPYFWCSETVMLQGGNSCFSLVSPTERILLMKFGSRCFPQVPVESVTEEEIGFQ